MAVSSPAEDIQAKLISLSKASDPTGTGTWPCYVATLPEDPDDCMAVLDAPGEKPTYTTGKTVYNSLVNIYVRSTSYSTGYAQIRAVMGALEQLAGFSYNSMTYPGLVMDRDPEHLGYDGKNRAVFQLRFRCPRQ